MREIIPMPSRRELIGGVLLGASTGRAAATRPKIAAVITEYRQNSHADVIVSRLLGGYEYDGVRREPAVQVVSMYTDQVPKNDMSRALSAKYGFPILPTVHQALTLDGGGLAVDGVVLIGEHGQYPDNEKGQKLYPRYELFRQIVEVFRASGRTVPVFSDKHLSVEWQKAKWMYDQSRELKFPFLAGSSLPVTWRRPPIEIRSGARIDRAVVTFYGGKEAYGFHALEALECMVERRKGGETGVAAVQAVEGPDVWKWTDSNTWSGPLLDAALGVTLDRKPGSPRDNVKEPILFLLEYRDGLRAAVYLLNGHVTQAGFAAQPDGHMAATQIWLQSGRPYSHFSALTHWIERMMVTRRAPYPVERTLLTTGTLAALMDSSFERGKGLATPHLRVRYPPPVESWFAQGPVPALDERPIA